MNNLRLAVLLLLGIVALVATETVMVRKGIGAHRVEVPRTLLPPYFEPTFVTLTRSGTAPIRLEKRLEWIMASPFHAEADSQVVMRLLDALAAAPLDVIVASAVKERVRAVPEMGLEHPVLTLEIGDGRRPAEQLVLGGPNPGGDGIYVAVRGSGRVFVMPSEILAAVDLTADDLRRRELLTVAVESIASFDIRRGAAGTLAFERDGDGWRVNGEKANVQKVRELLTAMATAKVQRFEWPKTGGAESETASESLLAGYGLDPESSVTVTFKLNGGGTRQLSFGRNSSQGAVYVYVRQAGAVAVVDERLRTLASAKIAAFVDSRLFAEPLSQVSQISIDGSNAVCTLHKGMGGKWLLESPVAAPADQSAVERLLTRLASLRTVDQDDQGVAVSFSTNAPPIRVRSESALGKEGPAALRSREVLRFEPGQLRRLVRSVGAANEAVAYDVEHKNWKTEGSVEGAQVAEDNVAGIVAALARLEAKQVLKLRIPAAELEAYGLAAPYLTLAIDQNREDAVRKNLLLGAVAPGGGRYATVGSADALFILSEATVEALAKPLLRK